MDPATGKQVNASVRTLGLVLLVMSSDARMIVQAGACALQDSASATHSDLAAVANMSDAPMIARDMAIASVENVNVQVTLAVRTACCRCIHRK